MDDPAGILSHWWNDAGTARLQAFASAGSFSGARLWKVHRDGADWALRQWPSGAVVQPRLQAIHELQLHLVAQGIAIVPAPLRSRSEATFAKIDGCLWELAPWMPGVADYWQDPRPAKLLAAMRVLAQVHQGASSLAPASSFPDWLKGDLQFIEPGRGPCAEGVFRRLSTAIRRRRNRLQELTSERLDSLAAVVAQGKPGGGSDLGREAIRLLQRTAPIELAKSEIWECAELPLQWRIGDVWHDHVLFTGDCVTGLVDFGAATIDSPSGDVARLLGSLVGDDREAWNRGMAAYEAVRPLSPLERDAVEYFDSSGTVLSAANWILWLWGRSSTLPATVDRNAAWARFERLVGRLRRLAEKAG